MSNPTPGPWHYDRLNWRNEPQEHKWYVHGDVREIESDDEDDPHPGATATSVCIVEGNATSMPICEDNARLIAASPTLLAVCEKILKQYRDWCDDDTSMFFSDDMIETLVEDMPNAVAKAKGV